MRLNNTINYFTDSSPTMYTSLGFDSRPQIIKIPLLHVPVGRLSMRISAGATLCQRLVLLVVLIGYPREYFLDL